MRGVQILIVSCLAIGAALAVIFLYMWTATPGGSQEEHQAYSDVQKMELLLQVSASSPEPAASVEDRHAITESVGENSAYTETQKFDLLNSI